MLELIHVEKSYQKHKVIHDLSFTVKPGEIVGMIGPNGAGKSTTVSMIAGLIPVDSGQILFHGEDIKKHPEGIQKRLGFVPQDIVLYESLSGYDNLKFWARAYHVETKQMMQRIERVSQIIDFDQTVLKKKVKEYSGGMKRRLNIAVALLHEPELVILDEPTVGIDLSSRTQILNSIKLLSKEGVAVIYIGHYMEEVTSLCTRVLMMKEGKCILDAALPDCLKAGETSITLEQLYEKKYDN